VANVHTGEAISPPAVYLYQAMCHRLCQSYLVANGNVISGRAGAGKICMRVHTLPPPFAATVCKQRIQAYTQRQARREIKVHLMDK